MSMAAHQPPPPLREGDRLSRDEFMRRYEAMPDLEHAELIDGIVYMPSPASNIHSDFHGLCMAWLVYYWTATPGCALRPTATWLMLDDAAPEPDIALMVLPEYGGQSKLERGYAAGAPELVVEVSLTTVAKDTGVKSQLYQRSGVQEYVVVQPAVPKLTWQVSVRGKYKELAAGEDGLFRSRVFPGLWLNSDQLWRHDLAGMMATIQSGAATPEHAAFIEKLARQKR